MTPSDSVWKKGLIALLAALLFTAGLGVLVYLGIARDRIAPRPRTVAPATLTPLPNPITPSPLAAVVNTLAPADSVEGLVTDYSPGALIIALQPLQGSISQVIVPENLEVVWADGRRASPREITIGQTVYAEGDLDALGRLIASRIVITRLAASTATETPQTPTPAPTLTVSQAWLAEFYDNMHLEGSPVLVREDATIDFQWGEGAPATGMPQEGFSVRWRGRWPFKEGGYRFYAFSDDGVRMWVDGQLIINQWKDQSPTLSFGDLFVGTGLHDIQVEYYDGQYNAEIRVWWDFQGTYPDWRGAYYLGANFKGEPVLVRNDADVAFDWGVYAPGEGVPADDFCVRWARTITFAEGPYVLSARADDAIRVLVDGVTLIDEWHQSRNETFERYLWLAEGPHDIQVDYAEYGGDASVRVWWKLLDDFEFWRGEYYDNADLSGHPALVRDDEYIDFDWNSSSPDPGLPADGFSARWSRTWKLDAGTYLFWAEADDGVRVLVDDDPIIDEWHDASAPRYEETVRLGAGKHEITVEYYERVDRARIRVGWDLAQATATATAAPSITPTDTPEPTASVTSPPPSATPTATLRPTTVISVLTPIAPTATVEPTTATAEAPTPEPPTATPEEAYPESQTPQSESSPTATHTPQP